MHQSRVRLAEFRPTALRGRPVLVEASWYATKMVFFVTWIPWPSSWKTAILRAFGASVGKGVVIRPRVDIHMPWKLTIGDDVWIGQEVYILNLEPIGISSNVCISQRAFLCSGNHDYKSESLQYNGKPIEIASGAWIGAQAFVGPGVSIGIDAVVSAGSVVTQDLPDRQVCAGNPCKPVRPRVFHGDDRTAPPPSGTGHQLRERSRIE